MLSLDLLEKKFSLTCTKYENSSQKDLLHNCHVAKACLKPRFKIMGLEAIFDKVDLVQCSKPKYLQWYFYSMLHTWDILIFGILFPMHFFRNI